MPRVAQRQRLVPLCDAAAQCAPCASLQGFIENERALELPMVLSKKGLAHVQQTVGWLMAPQGGGWALQMAVADGELHRAYSKHWSLFFFAINGEGCSAWLRSLLHPLCR